MSTRTAAPSTDDLFTATYTEYRDTVRWAILKRLGSTGDADLAEDLTQETFLKLYRLRDRIEFDRPMGGLLKVMARQAITNHYRVMRNTREVPADTGHWAYANRALVPAAGGTLKPLNAQPGDSDPDADELLRRARESKPRALAGAR